MSICLDEPRLQAVADGEASDLDMRHANACPVCRERVLQARATTSDFARRLSDVPVPAQLTSRVAAAVARQTEAVGATTLRRVAPRRPGWLVAGGALAAAVVAMVFVLWPSIDPAGRLNASEILNRSLQTLTVSGTEMLKYELSVQAPSALAGESGTFVIEQLIDHQSGRWRLARFAADGTLVNGIAEDPTSNTREAVIRHDGRVFRFQFHVAPEQRVPLWQLQRRVAETMIRVVQASTASQIVTMETGPDGARYVIDLPAAESSGASFYDLSRAHVVVDARDYNVIEFSAAGVAMGEPVSFGFRLFERSLSTTAPAAADFALPLADAATAVTIAGEGTKAPPQDLFVALLRELSQLKP